MCEHGILNRINRLLVRLCVDRIVVAESGKHPPGHDWTAAAQTGSMATFAARGARIPARRPGSRNPDLVNRPK